MDWYTEDLKKETKNLFESKLLKKIENNDLEAIARNLTEFLEVYLKFAAKNDPKKPIES